MIDFSFSHESQIFTVGLLLPLDQETAAITLCDRIARNNSGKLKFLLNKVTYPPFVWFR